MICPLFVDFLDILSKHVHVMDISGADVHIAANLKELGYGG